MEKPVQKDFGQDLKAYGAAMRKWRSEESGSKAQTAKGYKPAGTARTQGPKFSRAHKMIKAQNPGQTDKFYEDQTYKYLDKDKKKTGRQAAAADAGKSDK